MEAAQPFAGQLAVITGASSGIGRATAQALAAQGAALCLIGRNRRALQAVIDGLPARPPQVFLYEADFADDTNLSQLRAELERDIAAVDALVHSAGAFSRGSTCDADIEAFDWQYRVNVRAPYALTQTLLPALMLRQGQVVFLNSSAGLTAKAGVGQYAATKHALKAVADSLRDEVNSAGVRVVSVYPGRTASPMQEAIFRSEGREYHPECLMQPEDVASVVVHALLLPRTAEITDINVRPTLKP